MNTVKQHADGYLIRHKPACIHECFCFHPQFRAIPDVRTENIAG